MLHTSDWHLGRRFFGRSLLRDQEYVLDQMINLARDLTPDLVLVAGDVFDQRRPEEEALKLFHDTLNRFLSLGASVLFLAGPSDDFAALHLDGRWVREAGVHLVDDVTRVLSPMTFRGGRGGVEVKAWCLPYPRAGLGKLEEHPALVGHSLVEKVVQRLDHTEINLFFGYAWAQDAGRPPEFGSLIQTGGRPLEKRLLESFDASALGGRHEPLQMAGLQAGYSGSLMCYEVESEQPERSVTLYEIAGKGKIFTDHYPIRARRGLKLLSGSWEELVAQGPQFRTDDLIVIRSEERDLTPAQRAELRILSPNVVSVEFASPFQTDGSQESEELPEVLADFLQFAREMGQELSQESVDILQEIDFET